MTADSPDISESQAINIFTELFPFQNTGYNISIYNWHHEEHTLQTINGVTAVLMICTSGRMMAFLIG